MGYSVILVGIQSACYLVKIFCLSVSHHFGSEIWHLVYKSIYHAFCQSVSQSVSHEEVNVTKFKIKSRSFLLVPVPAIVPAVCWKIPATKCMEPGPIFIKYGQTSITNGAQLTFLVPLVKAIENRACVRLHLLSSVWTVRVPWGKYITMQKEPAV